LTSSNCWRLANGRELIHAGDVTQQGAAGAIELDADEAHAGLHDIVQRVLEVFGARVVLVETDADARRVDFHELAEWILQSAADRDRAALDGVALREFFAADFAGRIDAGASFVDHDIVDVFAGEFGAEDFGDELLGLATGGAVADRDDADAMLANQCGQLGAAGG
jgi:hypothetical protein